VFVYVRFSVFVYRQKPYDELITRPRSPTDCLRFRKKPKWNGEFHGGRPRPIGAVVPMKKKIYRSDSKLLCVLKSVKWLQRKCLRLKTATEMKLTPFRGPQCRVFVLCVYSPLINSGRVYSQLKVEHCFCTHSSSAR
jgi:hypothetical protein